MNYLIWSNEHRAWWQPNECGYAIDPARAGRYPRDTAIAISRQRGRCIGEPLPELPIREDDLLAILDAEATP